MTDHEFLRECQRYFGAWPVEKPGILESVAGYIKTKSPSFLAALWPLVRDYRPDDWAGAMPPPDMGLLMRLAPRAAEYAETHPVELPPSPERKQIAEEDSPRATMTELRAALEETKAKLAAKKAAMDAALKPKAREIPEPTPKLRAFHDLDGVRGDEEVGLMPEFYDESMPMDERMRQYATRYRAKGTKGATT